MIAESAAHVQSSCSSLNLAPRPRARRTVNLRKSDSQLILPYLPPGRSRRQKSVYIRVVPIGFAETLRYCPFVRQKRPSKVSPRRWPVPDLVPLPEPGGGTTPEGLVRTRTRRGAAGATPHNGGATQHAPGAASRERDPASTIVRGPAVQECGSVVGGRTQDKPIPPQDKPYSSPFA